jgi:hypothetical protein
MTSSLFKSDDIKKLSLLFFQKLLMSNLPSQPNNFFATIFCPPIFLFSFFSYLILPQQIHFGQLLLDPSFKLQCDLNQMDSNL